MTLQYMEGFETTAENSDIKARGWNTSTSTTVHGVSVVAVPSRTGVGGRGLMLKGPYNTVNGLPFTAASSNDFGLYNTGKSINSLWKSGGFVLGFNATFNSTKQVELACYYPNQITYDGSKYYWAVGLISGTTVGIFYSTDLQNWTQTVTTPAVRVDVYIQVIGSGPNATIVVGGNFADSYGSTPTQQQAYYSQDMGTTWTAIAYGSQQGWAGSSLATGSAKYPFITVAGYTDTSTDTNAGLFFFTSSNLSGGGNNLGMAVKVGAWTGQSAYSTYFSMARSKQGYACFQSTAVPYNSNGNAGNTIMPQSVASYWTIASLASALDTQSSYTKTASITGLQFDICYFAPTRTWVSAGYGGVWTAPESSAAGSTPVGPTAGWVNPVALGTLSAWSVDTNGSIIVAVGHDPSSTNPMGAIYTSTDGVTWTKSNHFTASSANTSGSAIGLMRFSSVFWDGARFIVTGMRNVSFLLTSSDGLVWGCQYYPDYTEAAASVCSSFLGFYGGTLANGVYTGWTTTSTSNNGVGIYAAAVSSGARTVSSIVVNGAGNVGTSYGPTQSLSVAAGVSLSHYYEIIATPQAGYPNAFTYQIAIDGVIIGSISGINTNSGLLAAAGDTGTTMLLINLPRSGTFTVIDDIYLTDFVADAAGNTGQLGVVNIVGGQPTSDVNDHFLQTGSTGTHAAQVAVPLSQSQGAVYSYDVGAQDVYGVTSAIPANYRVQAVQAEAFFARYGTTGGIASVGLVSNGAEVDSTSVSALTATPVMASLIQPVDPKTNSQWTIAGARAAQLVVTKTT
jgi:hypothetical protein